MKSRGESKREKDGEEENKFMNENETFFAGTIIVTETREWARASPLMRVVISMIQMENCWLNLRTIERWSTIIVMVLYIHLRLGPFLFGSKHHSNIIIIEV